MGMGASGRCLDPLFWVFLPSHLHPSSIPQLLLCMVWCRGEEEGGPECLSLPSFSLKPGWQVLLGVQMKSQACPG